MSDSPYGWLFSYSTLPSLAFRRLFRFTQGTLEALSGSPEVGNQDSTSCDATDSVSEDIGSENLGDFADHDPDASGGSASATVTKLDTVESIPETLSSQNHEPSRDVIGALLVNDSETLGHERCVSHVPPMLTAYSRVIRCANRPRNPRSPWLPRFPNLRRRLPAQPREIPPHDLSRRPRSTSFPKQRFLVDTKYPRLSSSDPRRLDIEDSLRYLSDQRTQGHQSPKNSVVLRPLPNNVPLFVEINGICRNKRRAEDPEVDLVAALHCSQDTNLLSCVTISRSPFTPDSELEYQAKYQPVSKRVTGMMSNILSTFSELGDKLRRYLHNQPYAISETRSYVAVPKLEGLHVATKRRKIASDESDFEWLDRDGLNLLVSRYDHFRDCFHRTCTIVRQCPSRAQMNKLLRPLLPVLADNEDDLEKLHAGEDGYDLSSLYLLLCQRMVAFLDTVYEIGNFIKAKDKHAKVPRTFEYPISTETLQTVIRTKNFTSTPHLVPVLRRILDVGGHVEDAYPLPIDIIGYVVLDMTAVEHNIIIPSYIKPNYFHKKLFDEFLPPGLKTKSFESVPGTYPKVDSQRLKQPDLTKETQIHKPELAPLTSPSTPPSRIRKADSTKTGHLRARFLAAELDQLTPTGFRAKFYSQDATSELIKESYITDFEAKRPLKDHEIRAVRSILKDRKAPKRLTMRRAPKSVRFTESTLAPRQRTHLGLDIPRLLPASEVSIRHDFISGIQHAQTDRSEAASPKDVSFQAVQSPGLRRYDLGYKSIFRGTKSALLQKHDKEDIDPSAAIKKILSLPSIQSLAISDDTKAGIALEKERAAQKAAEEAKKLADERARKEREERLAKSGGLRIPDQPLVSPLSSDWLARAHATLRASASTTLATTGEGVDLRRHDFAKVVPPTEWLNDEIVNGSLNWLDQFVNMAAGIKDTKKSTRKCLAMSSFFFKRLQEQGVTRTQRTLRRYGVDKKNFLKVDTILLPICEHSHWTLIVVRPSKRTIAHMDSMNPRGSQQYIKLGLAWLKDIMEDQFVESEWKVVRHEAPKQTNGYDCGVHTITNGMCVALGLNPIDSYASEDMPGQRLRIASMLLNGGFKGDFDLRLY
ncbi:hypothetical protein C2857_001362 [Epichloe festucae Fl1]|uniref:Ubiquitin-like protease family profile domain-containing protein n=1 Tax=Epichloe festucae (strain Fl1) TaxID=877507 RepID=A0A7U3PZT7_EPIFF|nr:hypothetical protein C2857_001362 [Epichloe festucae Fl1]